MNFINGNGLSQKLFADKNKEDVSIKKKWVYRIFLTQDIPLEQMQKIFPEESMF
jgi:hypothetical protein